MNRLAKNPFAELDYSAEDYLPEASLQIYKWVDANMVDRENDTDMLRASAGPLCVLRRWLQARGIKGRRMAPRSILNFILGEVYEHTMKHIVKSANAGPGKLYSEINFGEVIGQFPIQDRLFDIHKQIASKTIIGPLTITGHWDGMGKRNSDGKWEMIEFKSSGNYGFKQFKTHGPKEYLKQSHVLMMSEEAKALGITETRYFYGRKSSGHPWDTAIAYNETMAEITRQEYLMSVAPQPPHPPHSLVREKEQGGFTGRMVAKLFPCSFCPYLNTPHCHNNLKAYTRKDGDGHRRTTWVLNPKGAK